MVPKIHAKGSSFKGCAQYLLHDKDAETSQRVAWTETRNLATNNPDAAWRVMAHTSYEQDNLKREAGVPNTGRKSKAHVLHFSLSWHQDEADRLTPEEQRSAVDAILNVMGVGDRQVLIVSHNDEPQPHVHVMVNRVSPTDGRMLSSSFEKLKSSRWAQAYEEERGKIYCHERVINNAARDRGEYVRGQKDEARHLFDRRETAGNDNKKLSAQEAVKRRWAAFYRKQREQKNDHSAQLTGLAKNAQEGRQQLANDQGKAQAINQQEIRDRYRPEWSSLHHQHQADLAAFEKREAEFMGRFKNAFSMIDFGTLMSRKEGNSDGRAATLGEIFKLGDAGSRLQMLERQQEQREVALLKAQQKEEQQGHRDVGEQYRDMKAEAFNDLAKKRSDLLLRQGMENAQLNAEWQAGNRRSKPDSDLRGTDQKSTPQNAPRGPGSKPGDTAGGKPLNSPSRSSGGPGTKASDLLPQVDAEARAKQIERLKQIQEDKVKHDSKPDQDRDQGGDRGR